MLFHKSMPLIYGRTFIVGTTQVSNFILYTEISSSFLTFKAREEEKKFWVANLSCVHCSSAYYWFISALFQPYIATRGEEKFEGWYLQTLLQREEVNKVSRWLGKAEKQFRITTKFILFPPCCESFLCMICFSF